MPPIEHSTLSGRHAPGAGRKLGDILCAKGYRRHRLTAERREQLKWVFPAKPDRPQRTRAAHRTGRVVQASSPVATSAAGGTPASDSSSSDDGGDPEPEPAAAVRLPPSSAALALADAFAHLLADLLTSGVLAPSRDGSPCPFTEAPSHAIPGAQRHVHHN